MQPPSVSIATGLLPKLSLLHAMARAGQLSAAAESLGIPQSTATRWVEALSRVVGVPLTHRVGGRTELTAAGRALAEAAGEARETVGVGVARALEAADPRRGRIAFGFMRTQASARAPELLRGYRAVRPQVRFALFEAAHEELVARLHAGSVDIALTALRDDDVDIEATELGREPFVVVMPSEHRLAGKDHLRLRELRDETFVGLSSTVALRQRIDRLCASGGIRPRYSFETEEVETVRGLAAAGAGLAILPARDSGPISGSVEIAVSPPQHRRIGLIVSTRRAVDPRVSEFRDWATTHTRIGRRSH
ncbi:LysR family transcriptional regulator [Saccharopolyspora mangrovi]|uniref:LysR family transcriptional regulator n=1 Tax=Saccharopolyspora mangrovi TaxID=3082379 RepID=A0ABU6ALF1_9PSEU|nr:LysR family transcriptional regulator [Saccharopolyspora sp. S2-29]MEB3372351.1 LysR family transcriptional regulator [Saccharopolyspora sp. S2-29]